MDLDPLPHLPITRLKALIPSLVASYLPNPLRSNHQRIHHVLISWPTQQILFSHAQRLAETYNSSIYQNAADKFRIPYWDYALSPCMPDIVNVPLVLIRTPSGLKNVSNPLLQYRFQLFPLNNTLFPAGQSGEGCLTTYNATIRFPVNGVSDCGSINANLQGSNLKANTVWFCS